jgi:hypothetical protein
MLELQLIQAIISTLSTSINNFSIEMLHKNKNSTTNPWQDNEYKIARKDIRDASNASLKSDTINIYKTLIKWKKTDYVHRKQEKLVHLLKIDSKKLWRKILTRKTKENNNIPLKDWNLYLKNLYESPNIMDNMPNGSTKDGVFYVEAIKFRVKQLSKGKAKDIEAYQDELLKIGGPILMHHIHKLFNLAIQQGFPKPWTQSLIVPIFKRGDKSNPSNYQKIMISPILAKLYGSILEKKIATWLEIHGKRVIVQAGFRGYHSTKDQDHLVTFSIIVEECRNDKIDLLCCFIDFRKAFDIVLKTNLWNRLEEIKVPFELRVVAVRLYEKFISKFRNIEG